MIASTDERNAAFAATVVVVVGATVTVTAVVAGEVVAGAVMRGALEGVLAVVVLVGLVGFGVVAAREDPQPDSTATSATGSVNRRTLGAGRGLGAREARMLFRLSTVRGRHLAACALLLAAAGCSSSPSRAGSVVAGPTTTMSARPTTSRGAATSTTRPAATTTTIRVATTTATTPPAPTTTTTATPAAPAAIRAQSIVVSASSYGSSYATFRAYDETAAGWVLRFGPWDARIGRNGFAPLGAKREGDGRTPSGTYGFSFFFGIDANPAVQFPYRDITSTSIVWDDDPSSANYNEWIDTRVADAGARPEPMHNAPFYDYGAVIVYNTNRTPGLGSAIFLHVSNGDSTAGCVALPVDRLLDVLRWLNPAVQPQIRMGVGVEAPT